jgi:hypothetical protein
MLIAFSSVAASLMFILSLGDWQQGQQALVDFVFFFKSSSRAVLAFFHKRSIKDIKYVKPIAEHRIGWPSFC